MLPQNVTVLRQKNGRGFVFEYKAQLIFFWKTYFYENVTLEDT